MRLFAAHIQDILGMQAVQVYHNPPVKSACGVIGCLGLTMQIQGVCLGFHPSFCSSCSNTLKSAAHAQHGGHHSRLNWLFSLASGSG